MTHRQKFSIQMTQKRTRYKARILSLFLTIFLTLTTWSAQAATLPTLQACSSVTADDLFYLRDFGAATTTSDCKGTPAQVAAYLSTILIEDAITNGTTDKASSSNAIFDALGLKQDLLTNSAGLRGALSDETGTGAAVFANSPVFTTPNIGSATGSISGNAGTATALAANGGNCSSGSSPLGVDASGAVESCFDVWTEAENTAAAYLTSAAIDTSAELRGILTDETGSGFAVFATSPTIATADITTSRLNIPNSTSLPGTCTVGDAYMDTDATSGQRFYLCQATNTWALQGDGGGGGGAPTTVDYLVGTADAGLSGEIVVGTSPGGELGGTWASPTLDDSVAVTSWNITTAILSGKINADGSAVSDDDCTGDQGLYWYDDTDSAFEFCNANTGTPISIGAGSGDVTGPASSTDNALVRFDGTGGKTLQNSSFATLSDNGNLDIAYTDTDTAFSGTFDDAGKGIHITQSTNPASSSTAITTPILGENIWISSSSGSGTGHSISVLGRTDFTGSGDPVWQIPVEGRCDTTGTGVEDAAFVTTCTSFAATTGNDTGSTGNIGIYAGFYLGENSDDANVGTSAKFSLFADDADYTLRNDGNMQIGGRTEYFGDISPTSTGKQNDWNPTGLSNASVIRWNGADYLGLTGLSGGADGRVIKIINVTTDYLLWLENQNTASTAANRFILPGGLPAFLMPGDSIELTYDSTSSRWRVTDWPTRGEGMGLDYFTDFPNATAMTAIVSGTGASAQAGTYLVNSTERPMGVWQIDTGTTATGRATLGGGTTAGIVPTLGPALSVARLAVETTVSGTETFQVFSGFMDSAGGTATDGVAWNNRWNGAAAEWSQDRFAAAAATRTASGSPTPDNNYIWLVVFVNSNWTRADFIYSTDSVSFSLASSPTTGFPSSTQYTEWACASFIKSVGTTQRNVTIDLCGMRVDHVRG